MVIGRLEGPHPLVPSPMRRGETILVKSTPPRLLGEGAGGEVLTFITLRCYCTLFSQDLFFDHEH